MYMAIFWQRVIAPLYHCILADSEGIDSMVWAQNLNTVEKWQSYQIFLSCSHITDSIC